MILIGILKDQKIDNTEPAKNTLPCKSRGKIKKNSANIRTMIERQQFRNDSEKQEKFKIY